MRETKLVKTSIMLRILLLALCLLFCTPAYAADSCEITWNGTGIDGAAQWEFSGSVPTDETSRTQQAALEAFQAIFPDEAPESFPDGCYVYSWVNGFTSYEYYEVCTDGTFSSAFLTDYMDSGESSGTWDVECTTLVQLNVLTAEAGNAEVAVYWSTASEVDNAGFNIYRSENGKDYEPLNAGPIPAKGSPTQGAAYAFVDDDVENRIAYSYILEDVDLSGNTTKHGPVSATPRFVFSADR